METAEYVSAAPAVGDQGQRRIEIFNQLLKQAPKGSLLDLGAGALIFSKIAMEKGYKVTAVDARTERLPDEPWVGKIDFRHADLRDFKQNGFDVVLMLGILYHLDLEAQIDLLKRHCKSFVILDTQYADESEYSQNGYEGVLFDELKKTGKLNTTSSFGNTKSFIHTLDSLEKLFLSCGYAKIERIVPSTRSWVGPRSFFRCYPK